MRTSERGFTLIELALVMVIIGIMAGGGVGLVRTLSENKARQEGADSLNQAKVALTTFAGLHGRLPFADDDNDGVEDDGATSGTLPYQTLAIPPKDAFGRAVKYAVHSDLTEDVESGCDAMAAGLSGGPQVVEMLGSETAIPVAAMLISSGFRDADGDGDAFDAIDGAHGGDNTDGAPAYVRSPPTTGFDDMVRYVTPSEIYEATRCATARRTAQITVANTSGATVYLHDTTLGTCLGAISNGASLAFFASRGDSVELRTHVDYAAGSHVTSDPNGPLSALESMVLITP